MTCLLCGQEVENGIHVWQVHKMKYKVYYDQFLKIGSMGTCQKCGKETKFSPITQQYRRFCSKKCAGASKITKQVRKNTLLGKYGVENAAQIDKAKQKCELPIVSSTTMGF